MIDTGMIMVNIGILIPSPVHTNHPRTMIPIECGNSRQKTMVSLNGGVKCMNGGWDVFLVSIVIGLILISPHLVGV